MRYVPILSVFDIAQTDPIARASVPENPAQQLTGGDGYGVLSPLTAHLNDNGWTVVRQPLTRANGYTDPTQRTVIIGRRLAPEQAAKILSTKPHTSNSGLR